MNFNFDPPDLTALARGLVRELREKRLWPLAALLLVAIVAVPVLLSKSSSPTPLAPIAQPTPAPSQAAALPAVSVQSTPAQSRLTGSARNPFSQSGAGSSTAGAATIPPATGTTTTTPTGSTTTSGSTSGSGSSSGGSSPTTPIRSIVPNPKPKPAPAGLTPTQSYEVGFAITNSSGGVNTIDPLERLSPIPSAQQPLLVDLGVLQRGNRVVFVVRRGTVVGGPGACTPGPIDCEILSMAPGQTESLSVQSSTGVVQVALFAVTAITAAKHSSAAAADKARQAASKAGRALVDNSTLTALSLFHYQPSAGAVVDLRNLTVGEGS